MKRKIPQKPVDDEAERVTQKPVDDEAERIVERPDGYYWVDEVSRKQSGPYKTIEEAVVAMQSSEEGDYEPGESLEEAESEIGISNWIDPDTGEPAEEGVPRIEDH